MEILNLVIQILSLIATVGVSVVIFWLQRRHEIEIERQEEKRQKDIIQQTAKDFIIDNQKDIHMLPLCVIAASVNPYKMHNRSIYTRFNKCSKILQREILKQENIPLNVKISRDWVNECLDRFEMDCEKYNMGRSFLYEGAKYFHCAIEEFQFKGLEIESTSIFDVPNLSKFVFNTKSSLTLYIDRYLEYVLRDREDTADRPELLPQIPPMDMLNNRFNLKSCDLKTLNFWLMKFIISGCIAFSRHGLITDSEAEWRQVDITEDKLVTYEDMYYETLLMLYTTYGHNEN